VPAATPAAGQGAAGSRTTAVNDGAAGASGRTAATDGHAARDPDGAVVITFATNSSYFPPGAGKRLRELLAALGPEGRYQVSLQAAVSGATKVLGATSASEAERYNRWLAERRLERVRDWLLENAGADRLSITPEYLDKDESRRVVVRLAPASAS
jgi:hypothetical protein